MGVRELLLRGNSLGIHDLWLFLAAGLLLNVTPGPDMALIIARSTQQGTQVGVAAARSYHSCGHRAFSHTRHLGIRLHDREVGGSALSDLPGRADASRHLWGYIGAVQRRGIVCCLRPTGVYPGYPDQRPQSQGRGVLSGIPASVRRSRCAFEDLRVRDARVAVRRRWYGLESRRGMDRGTA